MNTTETTSHTNGLLACYATLMAIAASAADYVWMGSPQNGDWDGTSLNWNSGEAWVDNEASPNNAVFPSGAARAISVVGDHFVNDITVGASGYSFGGNGRLTVAGRFVIDAVTTLAVPLSGKDGELHFSSNGTGTQMVYLGNGSTYTQTKTFLECDATFAPNSDLCFGQVPAEPATNIFVSGSQPTIYANSSSPFILHSNRIVRIDAGKTLRLGASVDGFTIRGLVTSENSPGIAFNTNTMVYVREDWSKKIVLDPGESRTNSFGRLRQRGHLGIASGVTRIGSPSAVKTDNDALLYVKGNGKDFGNGGNLEISGGTLYASQSARYADVRDYAQVSVSNGGNVDMKGVEWIHGMASPAKLTVGDGGEFSVGAFRPHSKVTPSEVHLEEGGVFSPSHIYIEGTDRLCDFYLNGGCIRSRSGSSFLSPMTRSPTDGKWDGTRFLVCEKGAAFDTRKGIIWWGRPLVSGAMRDGGVRKIGGDVLVFMTTNCYNGTTSVEGGTLQARADNGIPPGTTMRLANRATFEPCDWDNGSRRTVQWLSRIEGDGTLNACESLHVTNSIAPSTGGTLEFKQICDLRGCLEIAANGDGCGCVKFNAAGQSLSGLTLKIAPGSILVPDKGAQFYKVVDAPNGYSDTQFAAVDLPNAWGVRYASDGVYLRHNDTTVIMVR